MTSDEKRAASSPIERLEEETFWESAKRLSNWGRWGPDDQLGTVNFITAEKVRAASNLIRSGRVFSLSIPLDQSGPQAGRYGRFNPILLMLRDGSDVYARELADTPRGIGAADDVLIIPSQSATQWDGLAHVFLDSKMWNGYDCRLVSSFGAEKNDIRQWADKIVGRAVLLDIPRYRGIDWCSPGDGITSEDLTGCAASQQVEIGEGDILLLRFGHIAQCRASQSWAGYAGGEAPGLTFDTLDWIADNRLAAVAADTWGVEVRPNQSDFVTQPWHRVAIPQMGLLVGEIFDLEALAHNCAEDGIYEFFLSANPLPVSGGVGGLVNPTAVK